MTFNKKYKNIFLDTDTPALDINEKVNIILSPSMYWVKKLTLLVKYVRDVKKLLPSIFEDTLPEGTYSYTAYKNPDSQGEDTEYFVFAYEDKKIIELLAEKNISMNNVASIHFAQSEMDKLDGAKKIDDLKSVYVKDDIVVVVPTQWLKETEDLDLSFINLSKHKVTLQQFGHIVDSKSLYKVVSVIVFLIFLVLTEFFMIQHKIENVEEKTTQLFSKNGLKSTMFQNKAMLKKYKNIHKKQTKLRKYVAHILSIKLLKGEKLTLLNFKNKVINANFSGIDKKHVAQIEKSVKSILSKKVKFKKVYKNNNLNLEITL